MRSDDVRELLDALPVLLAFVDSRGYVGWANRAFRDHFGIQPDRLPSTSTRTLFPDQDTDLPALIREVAESGTRMAGIIVPAFIPGRGDRTLKIDILPGSGKGNSEFALLCAADITDQVGLERLKKDAYEQIEKNIEQFATLGDRIRNPVMVITGLCDILTDETAAEKIRSQAMEIDRTVTLMDKGWIESEKVRSLMKKYYDVGVSGTHELVARAIHEEYLAQQKAAGQTRETNPSMVPWNELPRNLVESNLKQAEDIWKKLSRIGCGIGIMADNRSAPFEFTGDETEQLAIDEHNRWMEEKIQRGWVYGPDINPRDKVHNCLVPWKDLPDEQKEKDRNAIRTLPSVLAKVRLKIVRFDSGKDT